MWFVNKVVEEAGQWLLKQSGATGESVFLLLFGLGLLIIGFPYMRYDNRRRIAVEKKPRYGRLEFVIIATGGAVMTGLAIFLLLRP